MKKILSLLGLLILFETSFVSVISTTSQNQNYLANDNHQDFDSSNQNSQKISLDSILEQKELGILENANAKEILDLVEYLNPEIKVSELKVDQINNSFAEIKVKEDSEVYEQTFVGKIVNYQVQPKKSLTSLNLTTNLGAISLTSNNINNSQIIINKFKTLNPTLNSTSLEVYQPTILPTSAVIRSVKNGIYKDQIKVNFFPGLKDLSVDLTSTNISFIVNNQEATILTKLLEVNPNLNTAEIEIKNITKTYFYLIGKVGSSVYLRNTKVISFQMPTNSIKEELGTLKTLGEIESNEKSTILKALALKNPKIKLSEIEIITSQTENSFEILAKKDSHYYQKEDPIKIKFTLPVKIDLGQITNFSLINFRTDDQLENYVTKQLQILSQRKNLVKKTDFTIEKVEHINKNPLIRFYQVKANPLSYYLRGSYEIALIPPIKFNDLDLSAISDVPQIYTNTINNPGILNSFIKLVNNYFEKENIKEEDA
jgi:hypothetical protein